MPTPDSAAGFQTRRRPGESDFQQATRDDFDRLENQVAGYPECDERTNALWLLGRAREQAVVAAGKVK